MATPPPTETGRPSPSGSPLFTFRAVIGCLIVLGAAGWYNQKALIPLAAAWLGLQVLVRLSSRLALARLTYDLHLRPTHAFPGDAVQVRFTLENRKPVPVPWLELRLRLPAGLEPADPGMDSFEPLSFVNGVGGESSEPAPSWTEWIIPFTLPADSRKTINRTLTARRRGVHRLDPVRLVSGDPFGLWPKLREIPPGPPLVVYPRIYDLGEPDLPSREPLGEVQAASRLFQDPTRTIGLRPYTPDTPFKNLHWKATARQGRLQAKVFEPTTTYRVVLLLAGDGFTQGDDFERAVSLAASLAHHLTLKGIPVGAWSNLAVDPGGAAGIQHPPGAGLDHLAVLLGALARVSARVTTPLAGFLEMVEGGLTWGTSLIVIAARLDAEPVQALASLHRQGIRVQVYSTDGGPGGLDGLFDWAPVPAWDLGTAEPAREDRP